MSLTKEQITSVKGRGFLLNRGTACFSGRVVSVGGQFSSHDLSTLAACADTYGNGRVIFTSRLSAEVAGIPFDKIPAAESFMEAHGMHFGGTGAKVRPITACKGSTCVYGNIDTHALAEELHERFYIGYRSVKLPHKFKIGIGGCPNSCMKPSLNDIGIEGCRAFAFDVTKCKQCKKCAVSAACPSKAVSVGADGYAVCDEHKCLSCGVCIGKCPFGAFPREAEARVRIYVGGTWGRSQRMGSLLSQTYTPDEAAETVEKVMLWYKENGYAKERLGACIDRLGLDTLSSAIAGCDLIKRKAEILAAEVRERG